MSKNYTWEPRRTSSRIELGSSRTQIRGQLTSKSKNLEKNSRGKKLSRCKIHFENFVSREFYSRFLILEVKFPRIGVLEDSNNSSKMLALEWLWESYLDEKNLEFFYPRDFKISRKYFRDEAPLKSKNTPRGSNSSKTNFTYRGKFKKPREFFFPWGSHPRKNKRHRVKTAV